MLQSSSGDLAVIKPQLSDTNNLHLGGNFEVFLSSMLINSFVVFFSLIL